MRSDPRAIRREASEKALPHLRKIRAGLRNARAKRKKLGRPKAEVCKDGSYSTLEGRGGKAQAEVAQTAGRLYSNTEENKMTGIVTALRWVARLDGVSALVLGIILWTGSPGLLKIHILTGFIMSLTMLLIGLVGFFARVKPALPIIAVAWALLLPYVGFAQSKLFPGPTHVVIQGIHLFIGICAIGIAEALAAKIKPQARA